MAWDTVHLDITALEDIVPGVIQATTLSDIALMDMVVWDTVVTVVWGTAPSDTAVLIASGVLGATAAGTATILTTAALAIE